MQRKRLLVALAIAWALVAAFAFTFFETRSARSTPPPPQDTSNLRVPGGVAFSEFQGYETWQVISISNGSLLAVIVGNPQMIAAYKAGIPANGKHVPDGAKMAKIHWTTKRNPDIPGQPLMPDTLHDVDFMVKDSKRFAASGGWGYAQFDHDAASGEFKPMGTGAGCGFGCHTIVTKRDYVFSEYAKR